MESAENPCVLCCVLWSETNCSFTVWRVLRTLVSCAVSFQVEILTGKDNGKQGRVSMVMRPRNAVIVEGLNTVSIVHTSVQACVCVCMSV